MTPDLQELRDAIFGRMDQLDGRMDRLQTELSQTRTELIARIDASVAEAKVNMFQRLDEVAASLEESIRDSQTEVLRALVSAQEGNTLRLVDLERGDGALKERMAVIERRLLEIEKKLGGVT
jgi:recombinational DNA repair ATPase RecF